MSEVSYIQKDHPQGMRYSVVSHDAVTAKVRPALLKNGIVYYPRKVRYNQNGNRTEVFHVIRFVNIDEPTDYIDVQSFGYGVDTSDKGPGKAMSYSVKYALLKTLGLETGDDPDLHDVQHVSGPTKEQEATFETLQFALRECVGSVDKTEFLDWKRSQKDAYMSLTQEQQDQFRKESAEVEARLPEGVG